MSVLPFDRDQCDPVAHSRGVPVDPVGQGHVSDDAQTATALAGPTPPQATDAAASRGQSPGVGHPSDQTTLESTSRTGSSGPATVQPGEATSPPTPTVRAPRPADTLLLIVADVLDDLEHTRVANENRLRSLAQEGYDGTPEHARIRGLVDALATLEHGAELEVKRALRKHPLGPWVKATVGIGEKQGARLLAAIGDPAWNHAEQRPRRGPAELWAYCGLHVINPGQSPDDAQAARAGDPSGQGPHDAHDHLAAGVGHPGDQPASDAHEDRVSGVAPKRARGTKANWNATAKMRAHLVAESCIKQATSPYRAVYDTGRAKHANAVHAYPCAQCGPKGKPAQPGAPLSAGHQHARALRLVSKAILRDLFLAARDLQEQ